MDEANFDDVMNQVWRIAETDAPAAAELLEQHRPHPSFYPWGAHALMVQYRKLGRQEEARAVALDIAEKVPEFSTSWWHQVSLLRGTPEYESTCGRIVSCVRKPDFELRANAVTPFIECILVTRPTDADLVTERFVEHGLLSPQAAFVIVRTVEFLRDVGEKYLELAGHRGFRFWNLGVYNGRPSLFVKDDIAVVNLARLGVGGLNGWDAAYGERVTVAASALLHWIPYFDDRGTWSWRTVSAGDCYASVFWRSVFAPLLYLELRRIDDHVPSASPPAPALRRITFPCSEIGQQGPHLYLRPGMVEIWALWSLLHDRSNALAAAETVAEKALAALETQVGLSVGDQRPWTDAVENITRLSTNAGWYAKPGYAAVAFEEWAERYHAALSTGDLLSIVEPELLPIASLSPRFRQRPMPVSWNEEGFFQLIDKARVVFVTAFAADIQRHFDKGQLHALWRDLACDVTLGSLQTVSAPMSVWPYYPHDSWSRTFTLLCEEVAGAIEAEQATILVASCGAYGLPLVHEMHKRYGLATVYYGHQTNLYFGAVTSAGSRDRFFARNPTSKHWLSPDLTQRFPEVARIDEGRYAAARSA